MPNKKMTKKILPQKILIVRPDAIGDFVLTLPLVEALKIKYPNAEIHFLAQPYLNQITTLKIIPANQPFLKQLKAIKKEKYDIAILPFLDTSYAFLVWLARIPQRIGDANKLIPALFLNQAIKLNYQNLQIHVVEHNLKLSSLLPPSKSGPNNGSQKVPLLEGEAKQSEAGGADKAGGAGKIIIQPCTGGSDKSWNWENYVDIIRYIREHHSQKIVLTGAGEHEERIMDMIDTKSGIPCERLSGFGTLAQLVTLLKEAHLVIGTNTGPLHLAAHLKRPVISLFLSPHIKPLQWHPWKTQHICCLDDKESVYKAITTLLTKPPLTEQEMFEDDAKKSHTLLIYGETEELKIDGLKTIILKKASFLKRYQVICENNITLIYIPKKAPKWSWILLKYLTSLKLYVPPEIIWLQEHINKKISRAY
jgi:ADP-heptose:LPS heptosyltransferase